MITGRAGDAVRSFLEDVTGQTFGSDMQPRLQRWARLRLPNGQIVRSAWKEKSKPLDKVRMARNIRVCSLNIMCSLSRYLGHPVQGRRPLRSRIVCGSTVFFQAQVDDKVEAFALVSPYTEPDRGILEASSNTVCVCESTGDQELRLIRAKSITLDVAMVPFNDAGPRVFVVHKMGLEVGKLAGYIE